MHDLINTFIYYNWMCLVADHTLDYTSEYYRSAGISRLCEDKDLSKVEQIKDGDLIFVKTDYLKNRTFQAQIMPLINVPFSIISGCSSYTVDDYESIINNPNLIKWYCTNPPIRHDKVVGLPIGFEEKERAGGDQKIIQDCFYSVYDNKKDKILLPYHTISNNPDRDAAINHLRSLSIVEVQEEKLPFKEYLELLTQYKWCICLEGAGYDTHRNYECLLAHTVPIMLDTNVRIIYEDWDLPSVFVHSWHDVGESFLEDNPTQDFDLGVVERFLKTKSHMDRILSDG